MVTRNEQFITQMKLRELREQRTALLRTYAELQQQTQQAATEEERLRILYEGLRQMKFAGQPLHQDVANLDFLIRPAQHEDDSLEMLSFWRTALEQELGQGRLRAEIVYVFGALLEEWTLHHAEDTTPDPQAVQRQEELIALLMQSPPDPPQREAFLDALFAASDPPLDQTKARQIFSDELYQRLDAAELHAILTKISKGIHYAARTRGQAQSFLVDNVLLKELADALTIMLEHIEEWNWPEAGLPTYTSLHLTKWRLFLDEDLPTLCLLEVLGKRWQEAFARFSQALFPQEHLPQILAFKGAVTVPRLKLHSGQGDGQLQWQNIVDIWAERDKYNTSSASAEGPYAHYRSIFSYRAQTKGAINNIGDLMDYGAQPGQRSGSELALTLINAEIQLGRAVFPDVPLYVLKADLKDFYPRLSHALVLHILNRYSLPENQLSFFRKYLRIPLQQADQIRWTEQGLPNFHSLSDLLGELVMNLLEQYVQSKAQVQMVHLVDDLCIIAASEHEILRAWQALHTFCANCGLELNQEKCGSVCIGGEKPSALPANQPNWLLLTLNNQGQWQVNTTAFQAYLEQVRNEFQRKKSLLSQIEVYNTHLRYLVRTFALTVPLGETHRQSVSAAMHQFQRAFMSEQQGIVELLRQSIRQRFLGDDASTILPEAWLYWPITAGGCGLLHSAILPAIFAETEAQRPRLLAPNRRAKDWQYHSHEWGSYYYHNLLAPVTPSAPVPNQIMETLVSDFIKRGAELSAGKQKDLAPYWRWILYLYGPQIREHLGTFRFLITELVPLQIILKSYRQGENDDSGNTNTNNDFDL